MAKRKVKPQLSASDSTDRWILYGSLAVTAVIVGVIGFSAFQNGLNRNREIEGVIESTFVSGQHVESSIDYPTIPPAGGPHNPYWQNCGVYDEPITDEFAVHSLEHGAVWITYQPDLPADQVERLVDITNDSSHRLLSPYPGIDSPIILSAWGSQLKLDSADDDRLMQFIRKYEQGPTTPEPGALCSGGINLTARELANQG